MTARTISCQDTAALMNSDALFAVLDVRERGEFNGGQIPNATSLPRSQIEFRIESLVPSQDVSIVVYDEGGERAGLAAKTLLDLGYGETSVLDGGFAAWQKDGRQTATGVNVPSKAFGEEVHHNTHVPEITPEELKALQQAGADLTVLDVRTPEEYGRFCIPGGWNVPGGDLVLWAEELRRKTGSTIVVNCAGRTRSIIGTAALHRLGLTNARALRNGTMGWVLAGFELESKPTRAAPLAPAESREKAAALALRIAVEEGITRLGASELSSLLAGGNFEIVYLIDVRSENEYEAGHLPGSRNVPGGQAVQRADDFIAVRNARVVFISDQGSRAIMAAYWYRKMGFRDVRVLDGGLEAWCRNGGLVVPGVGQSEPLGFAAARKAASIVTPAEVNSLLQRSAAILDVGASTDFAAAHIKGANWISRGWLEPKLPERIEDYSQTVVLSCPDGKHSILASCALKELGYKNVFVLDGGVGRWIAAGYPTETGLQDCLVEPNDVVLSPSITGNKEDMRRYLDWEVKLQR
jgi:rhodanese-related sulfurtransferase